MTDRGPRATQAMGIRPERPQFFVWLINAKGVPTPQLWWGDRPFHKNDPQPILKRRLTTGEAAAIEAGKLTFQALQVMYPPPNIEVEG
jgi:hypothetical protein